jgi:periplasmic divalent cation tolerance protein
MAGFILVLVTSPRGSVAKKISKTILSRRLAACVNIVPLVQSHYWWKKKINSATEALLLIKTRKSLFKKLSREVRRVHPYSVPEIIAFPIASGFLPYLRWLRNETRP